MCMDDIKDKNNKLFRIYYTRNILPLENKIELDRYELIYNNYTLDIRKLNILDTKIWKIITNDLLGDKINIEDMILNMDLIKPQKAYPKFKTLFYKRQKNDPLVKLNIKRFELSQLIKDNKKEKNKSIKIKDNDKNNNNENNIEESNEDISINSILSDNNEIINEFSNSNLKKKPNEVWNKLSVEQKYNYQEEYYKEKKYYDFMLLFIKKYFFLYYDHKNKRFSKPNEIFAIEFTLNSILNNEFIPIDIYLKNGTDIYDLIEENEPEYLIKIKCEYIYQEIISLYNDKKELSIWKDIINEEYLYKNKINSAFELFYLDLKNTFKEPGYNFIKKLNRNELFSHFYQVLPDQFQELYKIEYQRIYLMNKYKNIIFEKLVKNISKKQLRLTKSQENIKNSDSNVSKKEKSKKSKKCKSKSKLRSKSEPINKD